MKGLLWIYLLSSCLLRASGCQASAAMDADSPLTVEKKGEQVMINHRLDRKHILRYVFDHALFNHLYTFRKVELVTQDKGRRSHEQIHTLNDAYSDNIGPFFIEPGGWTGGNHSFQNDMRTAEHCTVRFFLDGNEIKTDTCLQGTEVTILVQQQLFNPNLPKFSGDTTLLTEIFCEETVHYTIQKNTVQVSVSHLYKNEDPVVIKRYYGMQSMFENEQTVLTIDGPYQPFTPIDKVGQFDNASYPKFRRFVEKSAIGYQASFLFDKGLGGRQELADSAPIFIGNSYGKCYHNLLNDVSRQAGDQDHWSGSYTWFHQAIVDQKELFCYQGVLNGHDVIFVDCLVASHQTIHLPEDWEGSKIEILKSSGDIGLDEVIDDLLHISGAGSMILLKI